MQLSKLRQMLLSILIRLQNNPTPLDYKRRWTGTHRLLNDRVLRQSPLVICPPVSLGNDTSIYECYRRSLIYDLFDFIFPFSKVNISQPSTSIFLPSLEVPTMVHSEQP
jgi:hypothetical protein